MPVLKAFMNFASVAITVYSLTLFTRIILTWFPNARFGRFYRFLSGVTDPYLALFRRVRFFRVGDLDFSPIAGFILLSIAANITGVIARSGTLSAGFLVFIVLSVITSAFSFLLGLFALITVLRLIGYLTNADTYHSPVWRAIDMVSAPIIFGVSRLFFRRRPPHYRTSLVVTLLALIGGIVLIAVLMPFAMRALV